MKAICIKQKGTFKVIQGHRHWRHSIIRYRQHTISY